MGIATAIAELAKIFSSFFNYETTAKEHQSETTIIKKQKNADKALDTAEKIIFLCDGIIAKNYSFFEDSKDGKKQQKEYDRLRKRFFKYN